jgi:predicted nucleotide-binding protein (sugar kinase/HSP70/actin superfamily)
MAAEVLERLRLHVRPYEKSPGETDRVFESGIGEIARTVAGSNGSLPWLNRRMLSTLKKVVQRFRAIPVDRSDVRPMIGILGEFYTVLNRRTNHDLIPTLEALGAEVQIHGLTATNCFALFSEQYYPKSRWKDRNLTAALYYALRSRWLMSWVKQAEGLMPKELEGFGTLDARTVMEEVAPFIHYDIDPILATFTTRVRRFASNGVSGICNLFVLNCMLGNITVPIFKDALKGYQGLPVLSAIYDGQQATNMLTRIEAFMHQARLYQERSEQNRVP